MDSTAWERLVEAAGGEAKVAAYCAEQLAPPTPGSGPGKGDGGNPQSNPDPDPNGNAASGGTGNGLQKPEDKAANGKNG